MVAVSSLDLIYCVSIPLDLDLFSSNHQHPLQFPQNEDWAARGELTYFLGRNLMMCCAHADSMLGFEPTTHREFQGINWTIIGENMG